MDEVTVVMQGIDGLAGEGPRDERLIERVETGGGSGAACVELGNARAG